MRQVILADEPAVRAEALARLLPVQQEDFHGILEAMDGLPVTIRLLDPPLHEFLPREPAALEAMAGQLGIAVTDVADKAEALSEFNPMLGHRGCRLGLTSPEIYDMQVEAIVRATAALKAAGRDHAEDALADAELRPDRIGQHEELPGDLRSNDGHRAAPRMSSSLMYRPRSSLRLAAAGEVGRGAERLAHHARFVP